MTQPAMPHMRRGTLRRVPLPDGLDPASQGGGARAPATYTPRGLRGSRAIRTAAWTVLAAGVTAPLVRRRLRLSAPAVGVVSGAAPIALCVLRPRTRARDVATCCLQMWAYIALYQMPHDDPGALERRVHVDYPVRVDSLLGLGALPTLRLQRWLARPGRITRFDRLLIWVHWIWFLTPHAALAYILVRRRDMFARAATLMYAVFDLGLIGYWALPTAPPWYAAQRGRIEDDDMPALRRVMYEHGEQFWEDGWQPLYDFLGGNPLAAMPSLHFATSVMAAHLLSEVGRPAAVVGWSYAITLCLALVYLGEHYVIDLVAGLALTEGIRRAAAPVTPLTVRVSRCVQVLEARAAG
jgi:membrane-associated phospholipid phosphatase